MYHLLFIFFFFFQAEDGIRDLYVTGVQTCALPISPALVMSASRANVRWSGSRTLRRSNSAARSEERRVGKECRYRWSPDHEKKKTSSWNVEFYFSLASAAMGCAFSSSSTV